MIKIIGAGLAGSEAAWQIASRGVPVSLIEMRPNRLTSAHKTGMCAELVCSNSFRGADLSNAVGLLKEELKLWGSLIMEAALASAVPAGGALAVDRVHFSSYVHEKLKSNSLITLICAEQDSIPDASIESPVIIATGPLTSPTLANKIKAVLGQDHLSFYDAISPIITADSIDHNVVFRQSRYDKGGGSDYLNIPLTREEYYRFVEDVMKAEKYSAHANVENETIENIRPFEGCMPIEDMVERGPDTLAFGPLKSVGLTDPRNGERPFAVVQLRQDDKAGTLWSMVGMQTRMKHGEQQRVFRSLPGLHNAEFVRLGSLHRNTFIDSPKCLAPTLMHRAKQGLFFAGQLTGVEGYVESTTGGLIAGLNALRLTQGYPLIELPSTTAIGALLSYISDPERTNFQPMNISFGLMPTYASGLTLDPNQKRPPKKELRLQFAQRALEITKELLTAIKP